MFTWYDNFHMKGFINNCSVASIGKLNYRFVGWFWLAIFIWYVADTIPIPSISSLIILIWKPMQSLSHHWMVSIDIAIFGKYVSLISKKNLRISFRRGNNFSSLRPSDTNKP